MVPVRDGAASLPALLDSLTSQTLDRAGFEILVVDDGSRDGSPSVARAYPGVTVLSTDRQRGSYAARNVGIHHARGRVLAFTDADCRPAADWLEALLAEFDRLGADLIGGCVVTPLDPQAGLPALVDVARHWDQNGFVERHGFAATANLACRRAVVERIGGFDGRLRSNGDREFCVRATAAGFELAYSHAAVVVHPPRERALELVRKAYRHGVGQAQTRRSLPGRNGIVSAVVGRSGRYGRPMLETAGIRTGRVKLLAVDAAGYALAAVPTIAGYLVGCARRRGAAPG